MIDHCYCLIIDLYHLSKRDSTNPCILEENLLKKEEKNISSMATRRNVNFDLFILHGWEKYETRLWF